MRVDEQLLCPCCKSGTYFGKILVFGVRDSIRDTVTVFLVHTWDLIGVAKPLWIIYNFCDSVDHYTYYC